MEANHQNDGSVIAAVLAGDVDQFECLVQRYQRPLLRVAEGKIGRRDWAEDVVQESFLCAFKSLHTYDSRYSFRTWLWTITLNQCRRWLQKRSRKPNVHSWSDQEQNSGCPPPELLDGQLDPFQSTLARERRATVDALLNELPDKQSTAVRLRYFGALKYQEIADTMQCSISSAKNWVRDGLLTLTQNLKREQPTAELLQDEVDEADECKR